MFTYLHQRVTRGGVRCSGSLERRSRQMTPDPRTRVYRATEVYLGIEQLRGGDICRRRLLAFNTPAVEEIHYAN